jgi:hypothetical protein
MLILGIDPGAKPGYATRQAGVLQVSTTFREAWSRVAFDIVAFETQHVRPRGSKIHHKTPLSLAVTAGWQMGHATAVLRLGLPPGIWRGMLWSDGYAQGYGIDGDATIARLKAWLPELATASGDECEAAGIEAAARMIGTAKTGVLRCGQAWHRVKQPWGFRIEPVSAAKKSARAFAKGLKERRK